MRVASRGARTAIGLAIAFLLAFPLLAAAALRGRSERSAPRPPAARSAVHGGTASLYTCSTAAENISPCTTSSGPGPNTTLTIQYAIENNSIEDDDIGLSCTPSGVVVSCDVPGDLLVRSGGRGTFTLTYTTGPNGGSGSVTVNAFGISSLTATVSVTVDVSPPSISIVPDGGTILVDTSSSHAQAFALSTTGVIPDGTVTFSLSCGQRLTPCTLGTLSQYTWPIVPFTIPVNYHTGASLAVTDRIMVHLSFQGSIGTFTDSAWVDVTTVSHAVTVTPHSATVTGRAGETSSVTFTVANVGTVHATYRLTTTCPTAGTNCTGVPDTIGVDANSNRSVVVFYTAGPAGSTRTVQLAAAYMGDATIRDQGTVTVTVPSTGGCTAGLSEIWPCAFTAPTKYTNTGGLTQAFTITNHNLEETVQYALTLDCTGPITGCDIVGGTTQNVASNSSKLITIGYATTGTPGTAAMTLSASDGVNTVVGQVTIPVSDPPTPPPVRSFALSPHYTTIEGDPGRAYTATFRIVNTSDTLAAFRYTTRCSGAAIASTCGHDTLTTTPLDANAGAGAVPITVATGTSLNATGSLTVVVWSVDEPTVRDSAMIDVTVTHSSTVVDVASVNPGSTFDPSLCVNVAITRRASYECGDLRLVYALPSTRTLNRTRTPVLIYDSRYSNPYVIVAAKVTLPADGRVPQTVVARLLDSVGVKLDSASWAGSNWAAGTARRIAIEFDPVATRNYPGGVHRYTLEVSRIYTDTTVRDTVTGTFFVVRRDHSQFGHGWWLAGLERLVFASGKNTLYWTGGDGAARAYVRSPTDPNVWGAPSMDRPDSIRKVGARYVRFLPHGLRVQFDTVNGCHMETVNRLNDTTRFHYAGICDRLDTLYLPPSGAGKKYIFTYNNPSAGVWQLARVDAPPVDGQPRIVSLVRNSNAQLTKIYGVTGDSVLFGYQASYDDRIVWRRDERGDTTRFTYARTLYGPLSQASVPITASTNAVTTFTPGERRGIKGSAAVSVEQSYTKVDGPRTDVGDSTLFWLDQFGAPRRIRNALGDETVLTHDATWPALMARVRAPSGQVMRATYDAHGNVATETDSATCAATCAVTSYTWDLAWDFVKDIVSPEGDAVHVQYDATTGNALWRQDGRGDSTRVVFRYYASGAARNRLASITYPDSSRDSLVYDPTLVNVRTVYEPLSQVTTDTTDDIGRVKAIVYPTGITVQSTFDLLDRVTQSVTTGGTDQVWVRTHYDPAGNPDTVTTWSLPDSTTTGSITRVYGYDRANRKVTETLVGYNTITWTYDPAGNLLNGGPRPASNTYDALNRLVLKAGSDSSWYAYDATGNLLAANNSAARISRRYNVNGTVATDTLRIATRRNADFTQHVYGLTFTYDLDHRRTTIGGVAHATYGYDPGAGMLTTVTDEGGNLFRFWYDGMARVRRLTRLAQRPDSIVEVRRYDALSRLWVRTQKAGSVYLHADTLVYGRIGKVIHNPGDTLDYTGLGQLKYARLNAAPGAESYSYDALGHRRQATVTGVQWSQSQYYYQPHSDRLSRADHPSSPLWDTTYYNMDPDGAMTGELTSHPFIVNSGCDLCTSKYYEHHDVSNYYDAERRLIQSVFRLDTVTSPGQSYPDPHYSRYHRVESYRYDALGRRVRQEIVRDTNCTTHDAASGCRNEVTWTIWDGDLIIGEARAPLDTTTLSEPPGRGAYGGTVVYTNASGVDTPLSINKDGAEVLPYATWHGAYDKGTCPATVCDGLAVDFPAGDATVFGEPPAFRNGPPSWYGSLITGMTDGSGYQYKRNRYYDPTTGQFTQEDPIGLAGGVNVYGYANGDPANYSDPFGLCPPRDDSPCTWGDVLTFGPSAGVQLGLSLGAGKLLNATLQLQAGPKVEIPITAKGADLVYTNEVSAEFTVTVAGQGKGIKRTFWSSQGADDTREVTSKSAVKEGGVNHEGRTTYKGGKWGVNAIFGFSVDINWAAVGDILSRVTPQWPDLTRTCPTIACQK